MSLFQLYTPMQTYTPSTLAIIEYIPSYKTYFRDLNLEWITAYFTVEEPDRRVLNNPEEYILQKGGFIFFAVYNEQVAGTCALIKENEQVYELAKMAVSPKFQGKKVGKALCQYAIEKAVQIGAKKLVLITNSRLEAALKMYKNFGFTEVDFSHNERIYERGDVKMELSLPVYAVRQAATQLKSIIYTVEPLLKAVSEQQASAKPLLNKWSKKEILGHLIDSASNNQHKWLRTWETDGVQFPGYSQDFWVEVQDYQQAHWSLLIELWKYFNLHLAHLMQQLPAEALAHQISIADGSPVTLEYMAIDYGKHLLHHLKQILPDLKV
jgi:N-acetylglutamate synthase-like GNAT family acetyltransferase